MTMSVGLIKVCAVVTLYRDERASLFIFEMIMCVYLLPLVETTVKNRIS